MGLPKEVNQLVKQAKAQGWFITRTKTTHLKWMSPTGKFFFSSGTPSDSRAIKNLKRDLKVNGFLEFNNKKGRRQ